MSLRDFQMTTAVYVNLMKNLLRDEHVSVYAFITF